MNLKTDLMSCINEDDFAEHDGNMRELTVTITLCEYRNLIREITVQEIKIERLADENTELEKKCEMLSKALATCKLPDFLEKLRFAFASDPEDEACDPDEEEQADALL